MTGGAEGASGGVRQRWAFVLFHTSAAAFRAEAAVRRLGLPGARLVPTPRELSSDCGVALRCPPAGLDAVAAALKADGVPVDRLC